jgi:transcriptional regulator with XRE-family HTH domain
MSLSIRPNYTRLDWKVNTRLDRNLRDTYTHVDNRAMNNPSTVSTRLDEAMRKAGFSQNALARLSGVPQPTINRILKGPTKQGPETDTLRKLARACNVSFEWLHEGTGEPPRAGSAKVTEIPVATPPPVVNETWLQRVDADEARLLDLYRSLTKHKQSVAMSYMKIAAGLVSTAEDTTEENSATGSNQAENGVQRK